MFGTTVGGPNGLVGSHIRATSTGASAGDAWPSANELTPPQPTASDNKNLHPIPMTPPNVCTDVTVAACA
jgi:hypothetical protein